MPLRSHRRESVRQYVATNMKLKSYPTSPRRVIEDDRGYVSDYKSSNITIPRSVTKTVKSENTSNKKLETDKELSTFVYMASEQRDSTPFRPRATLGSNEPFPFLVPTDPAPRHSLFYDLSYGAEAQNAYDEEEIQKQNQVRRSTRMSVTPRMSTAPRTSASRPSQTVRRVSRIPPAHEIRRASIAQRYENIAPVQNEEPLRNTIVKVRPYRIANLNESADVHRLPLKPRKRSLVRISIDGKLLRPVNKDKIKNSLRSESYIQSTMKIVKQGSNDRLESNLLEEIPTNDPGLQVEDPNLPNEIFEVIERHNNSEEGNNEDDKLTYDKFHFKQNDNDAVVYAVPTVSKKGRKSILQTVFPSRGRTKSILQDSAKSLTSKSPNDRPEINRKNIRFSMDTDVLSSEPRQRTLTQQPTMYVNMERGGTPMLVSEVLNPITSLFISDLKDPVPKDPANKPKEKNVWVKPRNTPPAAKKPAPQIQVYQEPVSKPQGIPNTKSPNRSYTPYDVEYTSSDESVIVYKRSRPSTNIRKSLRKQGVYAAHTPDVRFPQFTDVNEVSGPNEDQVQNDPSAEAKDVCGLRPSQEENKVKKTKGILLEGFETGSNDRFADFEDELDLIGYPSENMLKDSPNASDSKSKLRWRIIIKRGEEN